LSEWGEETGGEGGRLTGEQEIAKELYDREGGQSDKFLWLLVYCWLRFMLKGCAALISYASRFFTLEPGDVILTGMLMVPMVLPYIYICA